jgi:predicted double-glycine peptidase
MAGLISLTMLGVMAAATAQPVRPPPQPPVSQVDWFDCGVAALATLLSLQQGQRLPPQTLSAALAPTQAEQTLIRERGYSLYDLVLMARAAGAGAAVTRLDASALGQLALPALVYLALPTGPHFSVVTALTDQNVALADPSQGFMIWPLARFFEAWAPLGVGYALTITADPDASA